MILPSGRNITPCKGCFLKYNIDAFAGRVVTGPNGVPIPDLFWYGTSAATIGDMRSNAIWNVNMSRSASYWIRRIHGARTRRIHMMRVKLNWS